MEGSIRFDLYPKEVAEELRLHAREWRFDVSRLLGRGLLVVVMLLMLLPQGCGGGGSSTPPPQVDCSLYPAPATSLYVLPYQVGESYEVILTTGHYRKENGGVGLYAIDFALPLGATVTAARAGTVVAVRSNFLDSDPQDLHENFVFIRHADGSMGRYIHLAHNGTLVNQGDAVAQGEVIASSGSSGTASPHLHFDVQACCCNLPPNYNQLPCGQTVPLTFRNTTDPQPCGVSVGVSYTADPFVQDPR